MRPLVGWCLVTAALLAGCSLPSKAGYFYTGDPPDIEFCVSHRRFLVLSLEATSELAAFYANGQLGNVKDPQGRKHSPAATKDFLCNSAAFPGLMVDFINGTGIAKVKPGATAVGVCKSAVGNVQPFNVDSDATMASYFENKRNENPPRGYSKCLEMEQLDIDGDDPRCLRHFAATWGPHMGTREHPCGHGPGFAAPPGSTLPPTE